LDEPIPVVENVQYNEVNGRAAFSLSPSGVLAYRMGSSLGRDLQFTWFDRTGKQLGTLGKPGPYRLQALSRDGRRLVASEAVANSNLDLTMIDVERDTATGFTSGLGDDSSPVWTPDGLSVIFRTSIKGAQDLAIKAAGGATASRVLLETGVNKTPTDVSRDGSTLLYETGGINARLWALPLKEGAKPFQVFPGSTDVQRNGKWSPDGKLIAYQSGSPRGSSVFVQPYPPTGAREQISGANGTDPHWSSDGRQIFFITSDGQIMSVDLTVTGGQVRVSKPRELFKRTAHGPNIFEMDPKGERFLMLVDPQGSNAPEPAPEPLTVVVNWLATLKRR
jgi:Tol biopolymer transport system component